MLAAAVAACAVATAPPSGWDALGGVAGDHVVDITVALTQRNLAELERTFWRVSDPDSDQYGKFLTLDDIAAIVAPPPEAVAAVGMWARRVGSDVRGHATRDYISLRMNASRARAELGAELHRYRHAATGAEQTRALGGYSLPEELRPHVDLIFPLDELRAPRHASPRRAARRAARAAAARAPVSAWPKDCTGSFDVSHPPTPQAVWETYNISAAMRATTLGSVAVSGSPDLEDQFNPADLATFDKRCGLPALNFVDRGDGKVPDRKKCGKDNCGEGTLDISNEHMVAPNVPVQYWTDKYNDWLHWITLVNDDADAALVHSCSSSDPEKDLKAATRARIDTEFIKAGARGLTLAFSTGDNGPWAESGHKDTRFTPQYPASSPYAVGVGGTEFGKCGVVGGEVSVLVKSPCYDAGDGDTTASTLGYSGGGFSDAYAGPDYAKSAVAGWLKHAEAAGTLPPASYWNRTGKGYPDVSALAVSENVMGGEWSFGGGTSSSSPFFAGLVALLNGARLQKGMSPMGFINPWMYKVAAEYPGAFYDVTVGNNYYTSKNVGGKNIGFAAQPGWDPVTGLGTPNMAVLIKLATDGPTPPVPPTPPSPPAPGPTPPPAPPAVRYHCDTSTQQCVEATEGHSSLAKCKESCTPTPPAPTPAPAPKPPSPTPKPKPLNCHTPKYLSKCFDTGTAYKTEVRTGDEGGVKCCEDCSDDDSCLAYTINYAKSRCYLFHAAPGGAMKKSDDCDSGAKV